MAAHLRNKDLLVLGFWSDWDYLNKVLGEVLQDVQPISVTVVDPSPSDQLQQKAPELWALSHQENVLFEHAQELALDLLDELRRAFSAAFLRQMLAMGRPAFQLEMGVAPDQALMTLQTVDSETLYSWRRDAEGVPAGKPAKLTRPAPSEALGYFHLLLRHAGAVQTPDGYSLDGRIVRVVNGAVSVVRVFETNGGLI